MQSREAVRPRGAHEDSFSLLAHRPTGLRDRVRRDILRATQEPCSPADSRPTSGSWERIFIPRRIPYEFPGFEDLNVNNRPYLLPRNFCYVLLR